MQHKQPSFTLDESCIRWYSYHFNDSLLRNDISWRSWRVTLQRVLSEAQLEGQACAICTRIIPGYENAPVEHLGGYSLRTCLAHSEPSALTQSDPRTPEQFSTHDDES